MARPASPAVVTVEPELAELATAHGVTLSFWDWHGEPVEVDRQTVVDVLRVLGVDASSPAGLADALAVARRAAAAPGLPPTVVATAGRATTLPVAGPLTLQPEDGPQLTLAGATLPPDLPVGYYELTAGESQTHLLVVPERLPLPAGLGRAWGWMVQLYSLSSAQSWGIGDYRDLADLVAWSGSAEGGGAGLVLCNPLHAMTPAAPIESSPYYPSSRRFRSPLYLRISDTAEYAAADPELRRDVDRHRPTSTGDRIDRDAVWAAKSAALAALWPYARTDRLGSFRRGQGGALDDFATFCVLAELHGPDWRKWPTQLHDPTGPAVTRTRADQAERIAFHAWLQLLCDEQLAAAAGPGLAVGLVHDLAVGVDPGGADGWARQDLLVQEARVGCPPDAFNQLGQDWGMPPWQPQRLAEAGYRPFRDVVRAVLRHAGGVRVDHVMGLFRMWWVPRGNSGDRGAYVSYDARAMLGVLMIEASRAGAIVIGEDLGTVEPRVKETLAAAGVLGSDVAWFARGDDGTPLPPARWRAGALACVTTHDLPTVAGWLTDEPVRVRAELGQLPGSVEQERDRMGAERAALLGLLREQGLLPAGPVAIEDVVLALHRLLVASPATLVAATPGDAVGDLRQPNLPGTRDEYPNWRLPLADGDGRQVRLEELRGDPRVRRLVDVLAQVRSAGQAGDQAAGRIR